MITYIDEHRDSFGVEPICRTLQVAPSTYYAAKARLPSARAIRDRALSGDISRIHAEHFSVYGVRKAWRVLHREGVDVGRDQVGRLMRSLGLAGATRTRRIRTTRPALVSKRPADLVERVFRAAAPNRLLVADLTYIWTRAGFVYTAFVVDVFSRAIVGWRVSASLHTELALDALEMAIWSRRAADLAGLVHHSDRGVQYLAIRYTERLADAGAVTSIGSIGDSYDNALAESTIGLFKTEVIRRLGPWRHLEAVEFATLDWVDWFNTRRLLEPIGYVPPAEYEAQYYALASGGGARRHPYPDTALNGQAAERPHDLLLPNDRLVTEQVMPNA